MKKGFAVEGFIREDGTVKPLVGYDDTELREKIQKNTDDIDNLDSRVDAIEGSLGLEPLSFWINVETLAVRDEDKPALVEFVKDYIHKGGVVCNVYFYTIGQNDSIGGYNYSCTAHISTPTPIHTSGSIYIAVGNIYYALSFSYDTSAGEVTLGTTWTRGVKEVDDVPTEGSEKFLTSGAIKTALDGKAASTHSHSIADVIGLQSALNGKVPYYDGEVIIKHLDNAIQYPFDAASDVKNKVIALYNAIPKNTYVLCRVTLDNNDSAGTQDEFVTVPAFAYATEVQEDTWNVDIIFANGVKFSAGRQGTYAQSWTKTTNSFFS